MRVEIFIGFPFSVEEVEEQINNFIKDKKVIDIKYSITTGNVSALIMYEEKR